MKVKYSGSTTVTIVVAGQRYQFFPTSPNNTHDFPDKLEAEVDAAIKPYDDLNVIYENSAEKELTSEEILEKIDDHNNDPAAHSGSLASYQLKSEKNQPNGYAGLDNGGKVPVSALPNSVMEFKGFWNASTNTPSLADGSGSAGDVYEVSVAGTQNLGSGSQTFNAGEWVVYADGVWKKSNSSTASVPDATPSNRGLVSIAAQSFGGVKTFEDGAIFEDVVYINSSGPAAIVKGKDESGDSKSVAFLSGDSANGNSGDAVLGAGAVTQTAADPLVIQGVTFTQKSPFYSLGKTGNFVSVQIIVDDTNITNPANPTFFLRGGASQRLQIRVNSATTVSDLVAAFALAGSPVTDAFTVAGSGATTFTNTTQQFSGAKDAGEAILESLFQARIESTRLVIGAPTAVNGQVNIASATASGSDSSSALFIQSGQAEGTGDSGPISIRSADMQGTGGSGGTFLRTGTINGSIPSGATNISTGGTTQYATASSGALNLTTGNIGGLAGNSGSVNLNSGNVNTGSGTSGSVNIRSGNVSTATAVNSGAITINSGNIQNASATGNSGAVSIFSGANAGTGNTGNLLVISSGKPNVVGQLGNSGSATYGSGQAINGNSGAVNLNSGPITNSGTGNSGSTTVSTGDTITGNSGTLLLKSGLSSSNGTTGDVILEIGSTSGTKGRIRFKDGSEGVSGHVWTSTGTNGEGRWLAPSGGGGGFSWTTTIKTVANNNAVLADKDECFADTSGGAFLLDLPASPAIGARVRLIDKKGTWATNNLTVGRNGQNIKGAASNFAANVNYGFVEFVFSDATDGWLPVYQ